MFKDKKILILGMAKSGYEAALLLSKYTNNITVSDKNEKQNSKHIDKLVSKGIKIVLGDHPDDLMNEAIDYLIKNPGIKDDHKYVVLAKKLNVPVINEVELAYILMPKDITLIGITGSNGKTTTTLIIYEMLKRKYNNIHLTGNIGFPLSSFVRKIKSGDIVVMEVSVQQLLNLNKFKTNISVLTNLYEAHLDHVGNYDNYKTIKKKIFAHHTKDDIAIINYENKDSLDITNDIESTKYYFSNKYKKNCYIKDNSIYFNEEKIVNISDITIKGAHNYENVMASIIVAKIFNITNSDIINTLKEFKGAEHRIEFVKEINKRKIYNDSKSTNNVSTQTALKTFNDPIILMLGGLDRGQSFLELKEYLKNVKYVVAYGENKYKIKEDMDKMNIDCMLLNNLKDATKEAFRLSKEGDVILFSPASASWDQFKNFEERGKSFKRYVDKLV